MYIKPVNVMPHPIEALGDRKLESNSMVTHPALDLITMSLILDSAYIGWFQPSAAEHAPFFVWHRCLCQRAPISWWWGSMLC